MKKVLTPKERIEEIKVEIQKLLDEATSIADDHDESFEVNFFYDTSLKFKYNPMEIWAASDSCEWETSDEVHDGYWSEL